jgi:hypothetical protein
MTIWTCTSCGSPNGSIAEACFRCGAPRSAGVAPGPPGTHPDEPSLVPLARYDVLPPGGHPVAEQPGYQLPQHDQLPPYEQPAYQPYPPPPDQHPPYQQPPEQYQQPQYEPAPAFVPARPDPQLYGSAPPPAQRRRRWWVPVLVAVVVLLAAGAVTTVLLVERNKDDPVVQPSATTQVPTGGTGEPTPSAPTSSAPAPVGVVAIDPSVTDPRAADVASMFDTHFSAVNAKDYARALSVYDPAGVINPNDAGEAADFQQAVSTTTDSQIMLRSIGPSARGGVLDARVTFRSNQQAGYGPQERPNETCTAWDVTYTLTQPGGGAYKILAGKATNAPC